MSQCLSDNTHPVRFDAVEMLDTLDRARCGVAFRQIELLMVYRQPDRAMAVLRDLLYDTERERPTLDTYVAVVFDVRTVNLLEKNGYTTLRDVSGASDAELLAIPNIGAVNLDRIRQAVHCVQHGLPLEPADDVSDLAPDWPPPGIATRRRGLDCPDLENIYPVEVEPEGNVIVSSESKIEAALSVLLESREEALDEIDTKIESLTADIANLKRMRRLLAPAGSTKSTDGKTSGENNYEELANRIEEVLREHGPLRPKAIASALGHANYSYIGRCVAAYSGMFTKSADGLINLANAG